MFTILFIVFFAIPAALFLIGGILLPSAHLFFGGLVIAIVSAVFFVIMKGVEKQKREKEEGSA
ncbi:MAG: hypothetical protein M9951_12625 [Burkholderiaceae bacterium]|jgi:hypothetical protein|nr:hypothetical protein [Burkholderiaceae bacterium]MEB2319731.1 hypothetical protein [Pseudomonadota bacterium]